MEKGDQKSDEKRVITDTEVRVREESERREREREQRWNLVKVRFLFPLF